MVRIGVDFLQNINYTQLLYAFLVGGSLCVIGQILIDKTKLTSARIMVLYVVVGVILTALGNKCIIELKNKLKEIYDE